MPEFLAKYNVEAYMFDGGAFMPDPESHKPEYRFEAENDEHARMIAVAHIGSINTNYFGPKTELISLLKIEDVN